MTKINFTGREFLSEIDDDLSDTGDIDQLKSLLNRQRRKLASLLESILNTQFSYEHPVARTEYEVLFQKQNQMETDYHHFKDQYQHLAHACFYLINKTHDLLDERNRYYDQWQEQRSSLTPRPDWDKVSNVIDGGRERWKSLSISKTSEQLMEILIKEIADDSATHFPGLGEDESVLSFLRVPQEISLVNRRMRRRSTGLLIKEIWREKIRRSQDTHSLADHVANYFEKRFDSKIIAREMGYNLRDACLRYRNSNQINLFWGIVTGQIEEFVYHHQMKSIGQLLQHLLRLQTLLVPRSRESFSVSKTRKSIVIEPNSPALKSRANARLSLMSIRTVQESTEKTQELVMTDEQFLQSLKLFYPKKTSVQLDQLFESAKKDQYMFNGTIDLTSLFIEDDEGRFGQFLSTLIEQINEEKIIYVDQIEQILLGYPLITVTQFTRAVLMIDPQIDQNELNRYIRWVFLVEKDDESMKPIDFEDLLRRLENCACFQH